MKQLDEDRQPLGQDLRRDLGAELLQLMLDLLERLIRDLLSEPWQLVLEAFPDLVAGGLETFPWPREGCR